MTQASPTKRLVARLLLLAALFAVVWFVQHRRAVQRQLPSPPRSEQSTPNPSSGVQTANRAPDYVLEVLRFVRKNGEAPEGYVGGREFMNKENRLPGNASDGSPVRYSEWDVHPKIQGQNRGAERLITGSDHSAWYTRDHYKTFLKID